MSEKRQYQRLSCNIKADFEYYDGDPDTIDIESMVAIKGKGIILDISRGGLFLVTNARVGVAVPVRVLFSTKNKSLDIRGTIIRTGLVKNNPSEIVKKYASREVKGDSYIAMEFDQLQEAFNPSEL